MKEQIRTLIHNDRVVVLVNGQLTTDMPPEVARELARSLNQQAAMIENDMRNRADVTDQAVLMRAGSPIGLTANPKALDAAKTAAQWDSKLRRFMRRAPGIRSKEQFGLPIIKRGS